MPGLISQDFRIIFYLRDGAAVQLTEHFVRTTPVEDEYVFRFAAHGTNGANH